MAKLTMGDLTTSATQNEQKKLRKSNEQIMLDRALHLYGICWSEGRQKEVMRNCIKIAMHELGDQFYIEIIRYCNDMSISMSEYIDSQVKYLLKTFYEY